MHNSKNFFRVIISCILLSIFFFKLMAGFDAPVKNLKSRIVLASDDNSSQEDPEKKDDLKSDLNFNKEFNNSATDYLGGHLFSFVIIPHPHYQISFLSNHYPAVLTPPPNC